MIRVGLYSRDFSLKPLLSSALGKEFEFLAESTEAGIQRLALDEHCDVVILDLNSNHDGLKERIECATRLIEAQITLIVLADDVLRSMASELVGQGAYGYCRRPPSIRELRIMISRAHEHASVHRTANVQAAPETSDVDAAPSAEPFAEYGEYAMIGSSPALQYVQQLIERVTSIDASILVQGESGTGKELVARAIHSRGPRAKKPFIAVACGAIPETLIEAELFGHEKGAFTGSTGSREGYFEQAADGTLFLDEIGELTPYVQVKLLRVLQQREFNRLGSNKLIPLRARVIFATHRDLAQMVVEGKFRQDLYYRINVMKIETPSLQDHAEDIPVIASHLLRRYSAQFGRPLHRIEPDAMAILESYAWPGNVRELENVMQRAVILASGKSVRAEDLPDNVREQAGDIIDDSIAGGSFEAQLREYKIKLAEAAIRENHGNKTMAARSLSISRAYLHRLVRLAETDTFVTPASLAVPVERYN
ncbi:MAG TPA: sigma-54 dependent transcriptional regulator [Terracidiphilus sp.]|nr:sigma-54 dependent transcriptional regulator [Terracidiphilus sp.]